MKGAIQVAELLLQEGARVGLADLNGYQVFFYILLLLIANKGSKFYMNCAEDELVTKTHNYSCYLSTNGYLVSDRG